MTKSSSITYKENFMFSSEIRVMQKKFGLFVYALFSDLNCFLIGQTVIKLQLIFDKKLTVYNLKLSKTS